MQRFLLFTGCLLLPLLAQAHYPVMDCSRKDTSITCQVGFSDGTLAQGSEVVMYSYTDEELQRVVVDSSSRAHLNWHEGQFYIQFDVGHEMPAEFDYVEF
jgi:hypothetical protein